VPSLFARSMADLGTLVDSVDLHAKGWQDAFAEFGYAIEYLKIRSQIGKGGDQLLPVFLSQADMTTKAEAIEKRRSEIFKTRYLPKVVGFPNVRRKRPVSAAFALTSGDMSKLLTLKHSVRLGLKRCQTPQSRSSMARNDDAGGV
jgi:beta-phosphoglucomutase-like phosphatase (HAD superfamily)